MTNQITVTGRLAQDPELRFAKTGTAMCQVVVPDQKRVKNRDTGEWEDASATTWFRATVFKEAAEQLAEHAHKGDTVIVTGRLISREWTGREGDTRTSLEIDYATVAVVPTAPKADRGGWSGNQQADPWSTSSAPTGGAGNSYDEPPF